MNGVITLAMALGMMLVAIPAGASVAAGSTITVTIPTNGSCSASDVIAHSDSSDDVSVGDSQIVLTRHVTSEIPDNTDIQFTAQVNTPVSGCQMRQPVLMEINGKAVSPYENNISSGGATLSITARAPLTSEVSPTDPGVIQADCDENGIVDPEVILPDDTEFVTYSKSGEEVPGGTVTVTASAQNDYTFVDTSGWDVAADRKTATKTIELDDVDCPAPELEIPPIDPAVIQASCDGGNVVPPQVILPDDTEFVRYSKSGDEVPSGTVTVTATAGEGNELADVEGWDVSEDRKTATMTIRLDNIDCPVPPQEVVPTEPGIIQASCADGDVVAPRVILHDDTLAMTYSKSGDEVPGGTVTITATIHDGYTFGAADGWTISEDGTTSTRIVQLDDVDCTEPGPPEPGNGNGGADGGSDEGTAPSSSEGTYSALASTGVPHNTWWLVTGAVLLLLMGAGLVTATRSRS